MNIYEIYSYFEAFEDSAHEGSLQRHGGALLRGVRGGGVRVPAQAAVRVPRPQAREPHDRQQRLRARRRPRIRQKGHARSQDMDLLRHPRVYTPRYSNKM